MPDNAIKMWHSDPIADTRLVLVGYRIPEDAPVVGLRMRGADETLLSMTEARELHAALDEALQLAQSWQ